MATDAVSYPLSPVAVPANLAWPAVRKVQSLPGMAAATSMDGTDRDGGRSERLQARAPEMALIREAPAG